MGGDGERAVVPGVYSVRFGVQKSASQGMGFAEHRFAMA